MHGLDHIHHIEGSIPALIEKRKAQSEAERLWLLGFTRGLCISVAVVMIIAVIWASMTGAST